MDSETFVDLVLFMQANRQLLEGRDTQQMRTLVHENMGLLCASSTIRRAAVKAGIATKRSHARRHSRMYSSKVDCLLVTLADIANHVKFTPGEAFSEFARLARGNLGVKHARIPLPGTEEDEGGNGQGRLFPVESRDHAPI